MHACKLAQLEEPARTFLLRLMLLSTPTPWLPSCCWLAFRLRLSFVVALRVIVLFRGGVLLSCSQVLKDSAGRQLYRQPCSQVHRVASDGHKLNSR